MGAGAPPADRHPCRRWCIIAWGLGQHVHTAPAALSPPPLQHQLLTPPTRRPGHLPRKLGPTPPHHRQQPTLTLKGRLSSSQRSVPTSACCRRSSCCCWSHLLTAAAVAGQAAAGCCVELAAAAEGPACLLHRAAWVLVLQLNPCLHAAASAQGCCCCHGCCRWAPQHQEQQPPPPCAAAERAAWRILACKHTQAPFKMLNGT